MHCRPLFIIRPSIVGCAQQDPGPGSYHVRSISHIFWAITFLWLYLRSALMKGGFRMLVSLLASECVQRTLRGVAQYAISEDVAGWRCQVEGVTLRRRAMLLLVELFRVSLLVVLGCTRELSICLLCHISNYLFFHFRYRSFIHTLIELPLHCLLLCACMCDDPGKKLRLLVCNLKENGIVV